MRATLWVIAVGVTLTIALVRADTARTTAQNDAADVHALQQAVAIVTAARDRLQVRSEQAEHAAASADADATEQRALYTDLHGRFTACDTATRGLFLTKNW